MSSRRAPRRSAAALVSALSLFGLQGPPKHGFSEKIWVETLLLGLETSRDDNRSAAIIDALSPHAAHPRVRAAAGLLITTAERTADVDLAGSALRLLGERGAPVSKQLQDRLLRLVHPYWRCIGYTPAGVGDSPSKVGCGAPAHITASTPAGQVAGWAGWAAARVGPDRLAVAKVLTLLLLSFDEFTRAAAVDGLIELGPTGQALLEDALIRTKDPGVQLRLTEAWARSAGRQGRTPQLAPALLEVFRSRARQARPGRLRRSYHRLLLRLDPNPRKVVARMIADLSSGGDYFTLRDLATVGATASAALPAVIGALDQDGELYAACEALELIVPEGERPHVAAEVAVRLDSDRAYPLIRVLDRLGAPGADVLQKKLRDGDADLRRTLAGMRPETPKKGAPPRLSHFDGEEWQDALRERLREDSDPEVRAAAARRLHTPAACPALLARAEVETKPEAFAGLATGIAGCGAPAVAHLLDWAHADDPVGSAARRALAPKEGGAPRPPAPPEAVLRVLLGPADVEPLSRYRRPYRFDDKRLAGRLGADAVPDLVARLSAKAARVRSDAAYVLGVIGAPADPAGPALVITLDDHDEDVRQWAAWSLGHIGHARAIPDLVSATTDPRHSVRRSAAAALVRVGAPAAELTALLTAEDEAVVKATLEALARRDDVPSALFDILSQRLGDQDTDVQRYAARALARMGDSTPEVQEGLRILLRAKRARTRWAAADGLLKLGEPSDIVPALLVRRAAPKAAQAEDQEAMRNLERMLR